MNDEYLHQLVNGRWVVASYNAEASTWYAPMTALECRLTGCHTYFAPTLEGLGATTYAHRASALRAAKRAWGDV